MNSAAETRPQLAQAAVALRKTTEFLARELAVPTSEPPPWTEFEWRIARAAAAMQGVSSLLHAGLRWEGPEDWRRFLLEQRDQCVTRHRLIARLLDAIDSQARCESIPLVALKGAALHADGIYAAGERPMADIDLLVCDDDLKAVSRVLEFCDYAAAYSTRRHLVFQPRDRRITMPGRLGEHADNPIKIEVHTRIEEHLPLKAVDITQFLFSRMARFGLNAYPSVASLMMHLLLHAAGNMRARALRLIQLHDIALLAARFGPGDWEELLSARPGGRTLWWALAPLTLTARYYKGAIPPDIFASLYCECPWLLTKLTARQQLTDVSWSNMRIQAFPGVEWSRTPMEALRFMSNRIWPSHEALLELKEASAQIQGSASVPWYGISHGARILRWVFSRPPRVQTLLPVRAALAQEQLPPN